MMLRPSLGALTVAAVATPAANDAPAPAPTPPASSRPRAMLTTENAFVLWSHKHRQWWRGHQCGYTPDLHHAGVYREAEALDIVESSRGSREVERTVAIPLRDALARTPNIEPTRIDTVAWLLTSEVPAPALRPDLFYNPFLEVHP